MAGVTCEVCGCDHPVSWLLKCRNSDRCGLGRHFYCINSLKLSLDEIPDMDSVGVLECTLCASTSGTSSRKRATGAVQSGSKKLTPSSSSASLPDSLPDSQQAASEGHPSSLAHARYAAPVPPAVPSEQQRHPLGTAGSAFARLEAQEDLSGMVEPASNAAGLEDVGRDLGRAQSALRPLGSRNSGMPSAGSGPSRPSWPAAASAVAAEQNQRPDPFDFSFVDTDPVSASGSAATAQNQSQGRIALQGTSVQQHVAAAVAAPPAVAAAAAPAPMVTALSGRRAQPLHTDRLVNQVLDSSDEEDVRPQKRPKVEGTAPQPSKPRASHLQGSLSGVVAPGIQQHRDLHAQQQESLGRPQPEQGQPQPPISGREGALRAEGSSQGMQGRDARLLSSVPAAAEQVTGTATGNATAVGATGAGGKAHASLMDKFKGQLKTAGRCTQLTDRPPQDALQRGRKKHPNGAAGPALQAARAPQKQLDPELSAFDDLNTPPKRNGAAAASTRPPVAAGKTAGTAGISVPAAAGKPGPVAAAGMASDHATTTAAPKPGPTGPNGGTAARPPLALTGNGAGAHHGASAGSGSAGADRPKGSGAVLVGRGLSGAAAVRRAAGVVPAARTRVASFDISQALGGGSAAAKTGPGATAGAALAAPLQGSGALPTGLLESLGTQASADAGSKGQAAKERRVDLWECTVPLTFKGLPAPKPGGAQLLKLITQSISPHLSMVRLCNLLKAHAEAGAAEDWALMDSAGVPKTIVETRDFYQENVPCETCLVMNPQRTIGNAHQAFKELLSKLRAASRFLTLDLPFLKPEHIDDDPVLQRLLHALPGALPSDSDVRDRRGPYRLYFVPHEVPFDGMSLENGVKDCLLCLTGSRKHIYLMSLWDRTPAVERGFKGIVRSANKPPGPKRKVTFDTKDRNEHEDGRQLREKELGDLKEILANLRPKGAAGAGATDADMEAEEPADGPESAVALPPSDGPVQVQLSTEQAAGASAEALPALAESAVAAASQGSVKQTQAAAAAAEEETRARSSQGGLKGSGDAGAAAETSSRADARPAESAAAAHGRPGVQVPAGASGPSVHLPKVSVAQLGAQTATRVVLPPAVRRGGAAAMPSQKNGPRIVGDKQAGASVTRVAAAPQPAAPAASAQPAAPAAASAAAHTAQTAMVPPVAPAADSTTASASAPAAGPVSAAHPPLAPAGRSATASPATSGSGPAPAMASTSQPLPARPSGPRQGLDLPGSAPASKPIEGSAPATAAQPEGEASAKPLGPEQPPAESASETQAQAPHLEPVPRAVPASQPSAQTTTDERAGVIAGVSARPAKRPHSDALPEATPPSAPAPDSPAPAKAPSPSNGRLSPGAAAEGTTHGCDVTTDDTEPMDVSDEPFCMRFEWVVEAVGVVAERQALAAVNSLGQTPGAGNAADDGANAAALLPSTASTTSSPEGCVFADWGPLTGAPQAPAGLVDVEDGVLAMADSSRPVYDCEEQVRPQPQARSQRRWPSPPQPQAVKMQADDADAGSLVSAVAAAVSAEEADAASLDLDSTMRGEGGAASSGPRAAGKPVAAGRKRCMNDSSESCAHGAAEGSPPADGLAVAASGGELGVEWAAEVMGGADDGPGEESMSWRDLVPVTPFEYLGASAAGVDERPVPPLEADDLMDLMAPSESLGTWRDLVGVYGPVLNHHSAVQPKPEPPQQRPATPPVGTEAGAASGGAGAGAGGVVQAGKVGPKPPKLKCSWASTSLPVLQAALEVSGLLNLGLRSQLPRLIPDLQMLPGLPLRGCQIRLMTRGGEAAELEAGLNAASQELGFHWSSWSPDEPPKVLGNVQFLALSAPVVERMHDLPGLIMKSIAVHPIQLYRAEPLVRGLLLLADEVRRQKDLAEGPPDDVVAAERAATMEQALKLACSTAPTAAVDIQPLYPTRVVVMMDAKSFLGAEVSDLDQITGALVAGSRVWGEPWQLQMRASDIELIERQGKPEHQTTLAALKRPISVAGQPEALWGSLQQPVLLPLDPVVQSSSAEVVVLKDAVRLYRRRPARLVIAAYADKATDEDNAKVQGEDEQGNTETGKGEDKGKGTGKDSLSLHVFMGRKNKNILAGTVTEVLTFLDLLLKDSWQERCRRAGSACGGVDA